MTPLAELFPAIDDADVDKCHGSPHPICMSNAIDLSGAPTARKTINLPCHECLAPVATSTPETTRATRCAAHPATFECELCGSEVDADDVIVVSQHAYRDKIRSCAACVKACAEDAGYVEESEIEDAFATLAADDEEWTYAAMCMADNVHAQAVMRRDALDAGRCGLCGVPACSTHEERIGAGQ